jgi:hypothetical protein
MTELPSEVVLAHYGKKGMHWGVRRDAETGVRPVAQKLNDSKFGKASAANADRYNKKQSAKSAKKAASAERTQAIYGARVRQEARGRKYQESQGDLMVARTNKGKDRAEKTMRKLEKDFYTSGDAQMAMQATRGEKITAGIVYGAAGLIAVGMILGQK